MLGRQYVIDFCLSELSSINREKAYRIYVTDMLKTLTEGFYMAHGGKVSMPRFYDIVYEPAKPEETRTEAELVSDIKSKLFKGGGS